MTTPQLLASVRNLDEAVVAFAQGVAIIDLKAPERGSLGALPVDEVRTIRARLPSPQIISATVGDLPMDPEQLCQAIEVMHATAVDFIKVGFFPGGDWGSCLVLLSHLAGRGIPLVAVLFAEDGLPTETFIRRLHLSGFRGVMLDTRTKGNSRLCAYLSDAELATFVRLAHHNHLLCGLAGSLREADIPALSALTPDYLGFRGAICQQHNRIQALDPVALSAISAHFNVSRSDHVV